MKGGGDGWNYMAIGRIRYRSTRNEQAEETDRRTVPRKKIHIMRQKKREKKEMHKRKGEM